MMPRTDFGLHVDGTWDEACIRIWNDEMGEGEEIVIEGKVLQSRLPQILALFQSMAVVVQDHPKPRRLTSV